MVEVRNNPNGGRKVNRYGGVGVALVPTASVSILYLALEPVCSPWKYQGASKLQVANGILSARLSTCSIV